MHRLKPLIGSVLYAGFLPNAPGTWGSFFALIPIYFIVNNLPGYAMLIFTMVCSLLTLWVADVCEEVWGGDPSPLVMDEWAGQGMAFVYPAIFPFGNDLGTDIALLLAGFVFFRFFDIKKPLGVNKLQQLPGGWGILVDDLLGGFYAFICLSLVLFGISLF
jgi:phosphatidylglycerophosphatase A